MVKDLTLKIREHEVSALASQVSKFHVIRNYLKNLQRHLALSSISVLDGRDIGTVIFPNAAIKVFLTASSDVRAKRRLAEIKERDSHTELTFDSIKADIEERDRQDMEREIAPLKKADDAIEIDTSEKSIKSVVEIVEGLYLENKSRFQ
jgi:cytidylate kinase